MQCQALLPAVLRPMGSNVCAMIRGLRWLPIAANAVRLFAARSDKDWSLTDCLSFIVMGQKDIQEALTADNHFEQAGFRAVLATTPPPHLK